ncbi:LacI family DNA-binding transcriptional regulator [Agromyces atrinae]|uniref:DNA-binding LacI/PurR family transcriptional regulator n=1 Tax=Agromyces atrinae TaxID=592376 RepID=A0A852SHP2_9MICO|nr:LacI family DNA-binding transcriptional regulator [Agromyces atrinae]NYD68653.1 DNA-binding LacI/PurR family transcriptional regulator [Agromyces atrinae]
MDTPSRDDAAALPPTIYDVARVAFVSHATVSRVLNDHPNVAPATRDAVRRAIAELGFTRNETAAALSFSAARSERIGIIIEQISETGAHGNFVGALDELQQAGYRFELATADGPDRRRDALAALRRFDGVTAGILALVQTQPVRDALTASPTRSPLYIDEHLDRGSHDEPGAEELIGRAAADHVAELGRRRVLVVPGPADSLAARHRTGAFVDRARLHGLRVQVGAPGEWTAEAGFAAMMGLDPAEHDAVFAANDEMAFGVLHALRARSIGVPDDIAVLGVDDSPNSPHTDPPLSSVRHDLMSEGRLAARTLIASMRGTSKPDPADYLDVAVQARESTIGSRNP